MREPMTELPERHRRNLVRNGFVVVDDALDDRLIAEARGAVNGAESIEIDQNQNEPPGAREVFRTINRRLFEYADDLVGGEKLKHPDDADFGTYADEQSRVYVRSPGDGRITDPDASSDPKVGIHTDDQTDGDGALCVLAAGVYLDHVPPRNGGFTVWPGSHWWTAQHCELEEPNQDAEPGTRARAPGLRLREESPYDDLDDLLSGTDPFEIAGDAGSVIFWHPGLVHSSGIHARPGVLRMTAFSRFHVRSGAWEPADTNHPFALWDGIDEGLSRFEERIPSFGE